MLYYGGFKIYVLLAGDEKKQFTQPNEMKFGIETVLLYRELLVIYFRLPTR